MLKNTHKFSYKKCEKMFKKTSTNSAIKNAKIMLKNTHK
jgi:hypothetical protein